jgi:hypothetical protein
MINQEEYKSLLERAAKRKFKNININWGSWYTQYLYYETMWEAYFLDFISDYSKLTTQPEIQFVFWESCPGGMPFPHQNYAFDSSRYNNPIDGNYDKYLTRVCDNFSIVWKGTKVHNKIGDLIKFLGGQGIIIVDLYPTHGVSLKKENRQKLFDEVFAEYSIKKLTRIGNLTNGFPKSSIVNVTSELWSAGFNVISHSTSKSIENALLLNPPLTFTVY